MKYSVPTGLRLLGHVTIMQPNKLAFMERCEREFPIGHFRMWHRSLFVVSDPDLVSEVLVQRNDDFIKTWVLRTAVRPLFGEGLVTSSGETWKRSAARMRPRFQPRSVDAYVPAIHRHTEALLHSWKTGEIRDIPLDMSHLTLRIACEVLFGVEELEIRDALLSACDASQAFFSQWERSYFPIPVLVPTRENVVYRRSIRTLNRTIYQLIDRRRRAGSAEEGNIVAQLLAHREANGAPISDRAIRDELVTLFLATYETTAAMLAWTLYLICTHPPVEQRVRAELNDVLHGALPGTDAARKLPFLYDVLRESLRLYPSIPILGRAAARDTRIGNTKVPKTSEVLISPWAIQRSNRYYQEPLAFRPERWTPEFDRTLPRYAYIPFSGGPRVCMGQHMAVQEAMQILATLLQSAELEPVEGKIPVMDVGMTAVPRRGTLELRVRALTNTAPSTLAGARV